MRLAWAVERREARVGVEGGGGGGGGVGLPPPPLKRPRAETRMAAVWRDWRRRR
jgi:hypothetical protein